MSNLRIVGLLLGLIIIFWSFTNFRGPKWTRSGFFLSSLFGISLILVSLNPGIVNSLAQILSLEDAQRGRILSLMIASIVLLLLITIRNRARLGSTKIQLDLLLRRLAANNVPRSYESELCPIMVLIPAYNEEENLATLLPRIPSEINDQCVGVLVIDDGSEDDTAEVVKQQGYFVVSNIINRGQGAASRLGYDLLKKENVDVIVTMDADNQHQPEDIATLVGPIQKRELDLVIGSRVLGKSESHDSVRSLGVYLFTKLINSMTNLTLTDSSSGFKAFNVQSLHKLELLEDQFQSSEVIIEAAKKGLRIGEVPIHISPREHGVSKKGTNWSYGLNFIKVIVKTWYR